MIPRLRTITVLMLLAGLSLGVFASRAFSVLAPTVTRPVAPRHEIESRVEHYRDKYHLDDSRAARIRQTLVGYEQGVASLLYQLRKDHAAEFDRLRTIADDEIRSVLQTSGR
jgi:hypothetical protein